MDSATDQKIYDWIVLGAIALGGIGVLGLVAHVCITWISTGEFPFFILEQILEGPRGLLPGT